MPPAAALARIGTLLSYLDRHPATQVPQDPQGLKSLMDTAEHALVFGANVIPAGLMSLLSPFDLGARETTMLHAVAEAAAEGDPALIFEYLCSRFLDTGSRGSLAATLPELADLMLDLTGTDTGRLLDPACGTGAILLALVKRGYTRVEGQELNSSLALITALRLRLANAPAFDVQARASPRADPYPKESAHPACSD